MGKSHQKNIFKKTSKPIKEQGRCFDPQKILNKTKQNKTKMHRERERERKRSN
jgi:hypothetical protein